MQNATRIQMNTIQSVAERINRGNLDPVETFTKELADLDTAEAKLNDALNEVHARRDAIMALKALAQTREPAKAKAKA